MIYELFTLQYRERLKGVFHQTRRGYDSVVRTQALKLLLKMNLGPEEVREMFSETLDPWNTDHSLYVQSLIFDEARKNPTLRFAFVVATTRSENNRDVQIWSSLCVQMLCCLRASLNSRVVDRWFKCLNVTPRKHLHEVLRDATLGNFHTLSPNGKSLAFSSEMLGEECAIIMNI